MKKALSATAIATVCTLVGDLSCAAGLQLSGTVDLGLLFSRTEYGGALIDHAKYSDNQSFTMKAGGNSGNKITVHGAEDLGGGYSVEFKLDSGFVADSGTLGQGGRIAGREARLTLKTPYGEISFGRMGALTSGSGTYDIFMANADAMGYCNYIGTYNWVNRSRYDNMLTLATPKMTGFTGYAQYSFKTNGNEEPEAHRNERYAALGLTYSSGPFNIVLVADTILKATEEITDGVWQRASDSAYGNAKSLGFGINYDFGGQKLIFGAQYGKNELLDFRSSAAVLRFDGYNICLGIVTERSTGKLEAKLYYGDYEHSKLSGIDGNTYGAAVMNTYSLSKRTALYTGAGYYQFDLNARIDGEKGAARTKGFDVTVGLKHKF